MHPNGMARNLKPEENQVNQYGAKPNFHFLWTILYVVGTQINHQTKTLLSTQNTCLN